MENMLLNGKVAIVTGGARGIGLSIVKRFLQQGAKVMIADLVETEDEEIAELLRLGHSVLFSHTDVTDHASVNNMLDSVVERFGGADILVNNAGINHNGSVIESSIYDWEKVIKVNLIGSFICSKIICQHMVNSGRGESIIFMSSQAGKRGEDGASAYASSKFGLLGLMECLAVELADKGIRVNAVCPGNIDTPMLIWLISDIAEKRGVTYEEDFPTLLEDIPMGRLGKPEEIADVCVFLASPLASYVTGESVNVDGGQLSG